jgi:hypothetical protein
VYLRPAEGLQLQLQLQLQLPLPLPLPLPLQSQFAVLYLRPAEGRSCRIGGRVWAWPHGTMVRGPCPFSIRGTA